MFSMFGAPNIITYSLVRQEEIGHRFNCNYKPSHKLQPGQIQLKLGACANNWEQKRGTFFSISAKVSNAR